MISHLTIAHVFNTRVITRGEMEIPKDELRQFANGSWYVCIYYIPWGRYGVVKHYRYVETEEEAMWILKYSRRS